MKKLLMLLLLAVAIPMVAQAHENDLACGASTTAGVSGYKVYRAVCTGTISGTTCSADGAFTAIATLGTTCTYADTTVVAGNKFDYYFTAVCPAAGCGAGISGESLPSVHVAATTPPD